ANLLHVGAGTRACFLLAEALGLVIAGEERAAAVNGALFNGVLQGRLARLDLLPANVLPRSAAQRIILVVSIGDADVRDERVREGGDGDARAQVDVPEGGGPARGAERRAVGRLVLPVAAQERPLREGAHEV